MKKIGWSLIGAVGVIWFVIIFITSPMKTDKQEAYTAAGEKLTPSLFRFFGEDEAGDKLVEEINGLARINRALMAGSVVLFVAGCITIFVGGRSDPPEKKYKLSPENDYDGFVDELIDRDARLLLEGNCVYGLWNVSSSAKECQVKFEDFDEAKAYLLKESFFRCKKCDTHMPQCEFLAPLWRKVVGGGVVVFCGFFLLVGVLSLISGEPAFGPFLFVINVILVGSGIVMFRMKRSGVICKCRYRVS